MSLDDATTLDGAKCMLAELRGKVTALEAEKLTMTAHVELLRVHTAALEARAEHVADLRMHTASQHQHGEALKSQHDSALCELRLQNERAVTALEQQHHRTVTALTQQVDLLQQLLQSKDRHTASLERQLEDKEKLIQTKDERIQAGDKQLPELVKAATVEAIKAEMGAMRTAMQGKDLPELFKAALQSAAKQSDVVVVTKNAPPGAVVTGDNQVLGRRVKRGPDWKWEDQDGGVNSIGTIIVWNEATAPRANWCRVKWDSGKTNIYRAGAEKAHDLIYAA